MLALHGDLDRVAADQRFAVFVAAAPAAAFFRQQVTLDGFHVGHLAFDQLHDQPLDGLELVAEGRGGLLAVRRAGFVGVESEEELVRQVRGALRLFPDRGLGRLELVLKQRGRHRLARKGFRGERLLERGDGFDRVLFLRHQRVEIFLARRKFQILQPGEFGGEAGVARAGFVEAAHRAEQQIAKHAEAGDHDGEKSGEELVLLDPVHLGLAGRLGAFFKTSGMAKS